MSVTIGLKTLTVTDFTVSIENVGPEWWAWENQALTRKKFVYGQKRTWSFRCIEKNVAWTDSAAKYLAEQAAAGNTLLMVINFGDRYSVSSAYVIVDSVDISMEQVGTQNIRKFEVTVKEV